MKVYSISFRNVWGFEKTKTILATGLYLSMLQIRDVIRSHTNPLCLRSISNITPPPPPPFLPNNNKTTTTTTTTIITHTPSYTHKHTNLLEWNCIWLNETPQTWQLVTDMHDIASQNSHTKRRQIRPMIFYFVFFSFYRCNWNKSVFKIAKKKKKIPTWQLLAHIYHHYKSELSQEGHTRIPYVNISYRKKQCKQIS